MDFADKSSAATASIVINADAVKPTKFDRLNQEDKADLLSKSTITSNGEKNDHSKLVFPITKAQNLNEINFSDLLHIDEDGIEQSEFKALAATSEAQFVKDSSQSIQDIMEFISTSKENAPDAFGRADICRTEGRARLIINKGKIQEIYGYEIGNDTYLYAEEALYLLEKGKLEIYCDHIRLSVERARAILLHSKSTSETSSSVVTCDIDEYSVYKYLARLGMRIKRRSEESSNIQPPRGNNGDINESLSIGKSAATNEFMETDCDDASLSFQSAGAEINYDEDINRGVKRKLEDDSDASNTPLDLPEKQSLESMDVPCDMEDMETKCEISGNTEANNYTVVEADSDIEFDYDDSFTFNDRVYIEEVPEGFAAASGPREEMPCSSRSIRPNYEPHMVVDLPSSDSEAEDDNTYINKIWSKFVPGLNIKIGFPPSHLLPSSIGTRKEEYQFDFKRMLNPSCVDLEYFVDELDLNESPLEQDQKVYCKSWTEWRQIMVEEAKEIRNTSLLANSDFKSDNVIDKLNLWENNTTDTDNSQAAAGQTFHKFSSTYDIYPPSCCRVPKRRLLTHHKPSFRLAIVRSDEPIPELYPTTNDIPIVIAIVSDENEILFLSPESVPLTSLF